MRYLIFGISVIVLALTWEIFKSIDHYRVCRGLGHGAFYCTVSTMGN